MICTPSLILLKYKVEEDEVAWKCDPHGRLRVLENRALRRIFGPKREEVTMDWRKLHNEELNDLYASPNIVRVVKLKIIWAGHVERTG